MKTRLLLYFCVPTVALCAISDSAVNLKRDAKFCADAWNRGDYMTFVGCLSERVAPDDRAREATLAGIKQAFGYLDSLGLKTLQVAVREPKEIESAGPLQASILPVLAVMEGPDAKMTADESILGVSKDQGKSWKFLVLFKISQQQLDQRFPEFQGKIKVPFPRPPSVEIKGSPRPHVGGP